MCCPWSQKWTSPLIRCRTSQNYILKENLCFQHNWIFSNDQPHLAENVTISSETPTYFLPGAQILLLRRVCGGLRGLQSRCPGTHHPRAPLVLFWPLHGEGNHVTSWTTTATQLGQENSNLQHRDCNSQCKSCGFPVGISNVHIFKYLNTI